MSFHIHLSTLRRRSLMPLLVVGQVTLACAILCNVLFLIWLQLQPMLAPSGVDGANLILIDGLDAPQRPWTAAEVQVGVQALREVPGVHAVSAALGLPMLSRNLVVLALQGTTGVKVGVNVYYGENLIDSLGLQLVSGRNFLPDEYRVFGSKQGRGASESIIITESLGRQLFGDVSPLGQVLHAPGVEGAKAPGWLVVGVVRHLLRSQISMATGGRADDTVLLPERVEKTSSLSYSVRVDPSMPEAALHGVRKIIQSTFGPLMPVGSSPEIESYATRRAEIFKGSRAAIYLFAGVALTVLIVTVIGIMGLTAFWIQKRTKEIGIRRALGGRRIDILYYLLAENMLIVGTGVALGMALAYFGNVWLIRYYELQRLPWVFLPCGAALMLILGQLATLSPALRAALLPPVLATRSI